MRTLDLGEAVGPGVPTGGTANQVLVKNGSTNFDTSWKDAGTIPSIANMQDGLAIVANGNTHAAIASGQFVYVKNHGSLAEGLYKATAAIGTNATLSTSNLTADSAGGLNALKASVDTLNSKTTLSSITNLVNSEVAVSGDTAWHSSGDIQLTGNYKKYYIRVGVHGAVYNSAVIDVDALNFIGAGAPFMLSVFWDSNNLGQFRIYGSTVSATAKTKDYTFDYMVYGLK